MNILITSVGRRAYMVSYFKEALKGIGEVHVANCYKVFAMQIADKAVITPLIYNKAYIDFLINYCIKEEISAIISLFDIDLPILAKNKSRFEKNSIDVVVSSYDVTQICNDKWLTFHFLKENNFNCPETYITLQDCKNALEKGEVTFPLIVKPRWGMGSIGMYQADDIDELRVLYKKTKQIIFESYLKYESNLDPERIVIIQEKLNGQEFGLDVFNDLNGNFLTCVTKKKIGKYTSGETENAEIVDNKSLFELGKTLSKKLNHIANLDVDCFEIDNRNFVLELNCRFGGQYPFSHISGVNFPKAIVNMLMNKSVPKKYLQPTFGFVGTKILLPVILK